MKPAIARRCLCDESRLHGFNEAEGLPLRRWAIVKLKRPMIGLFVIEDVPEPPSVHCLPARLAQVEVVGLANRRSERREGVQHFPFGARRELEHREVVIRLGLAG